MTLTFKIEIENTNGSIIVLKTRGTACYVDDHTSYIGLSGLATRICYFVTMKTDLLSQIPCCGE